jgi:hypothetical protein
LSWWERVLLVVAGVLSVYPGIYYDVVGIVLGAALLLIRQRPDWQSRLIPGIRPKRKAS